MLRNNKYDIMDKKLKSCKRKIGILFAKLVVLSLKAEKSEIEDDELVKLFSDVMPIIKTNAHIVYENSKDLQKIDKEYIDRYLEEEEISKQVYEIDYKESINIYIQILLLLAIMERNGIDPLINDMEIVMKLFEGSDLDDFVNDSIDQLDPNSQQLVGQLFEKQFSVNDLNFELRNLLDRYHLKYMQKEIYPNVKEKKVTNKQVLKLTNKYLKRLQ